jgi:hypothetical protein
VSCVAAVVSDVGAVGTSEDGASITTDEGVEASTNGAAAGPEEGMNTSSCTRFGCHDVVVEDCRTTLPWCRSVRRVLDVRRAATARRGSRKKKLGQT